MTPQDYRKERNTLVRAIKARIRPHLWPSGYSGGLKLWLPRNAKGEFTKKSYKLAGYVATEFEGFAEDGVITDGFAGGLAVLGFDDMPLEDLYALDRWMTRRLPALLAVFPVNPTQPRATP